MEWVQENFPQQLRFNQVIFKSENVLSPEVVQDMYNLTMRMRQVTMAPIVIIVFFLKIWLVRRSHLNSSGI